MKSTLQRIIALAGSDMRNTVRDTTLLPLLLSPLLLIVVIRFGVPFAAELLAEGIGFELRSYYGLISYFMSAITPFLFGMMFGFLMLEERDEGVITVISITPVSKGGYLSYKLLLPSLLSFAAFLIVGLAIDLGTPRWPRFLASGFLSSLLAPLFALALASYAENRVEGLALAKGLGLLLLGPFAVYFAPEPWRYAAALIPTSWPAYLSFAETPASYLVAVGLGGLAVHIVLLYLLVGQFRRRVG